jgi:CubicO group peptidase (beta-lactamase class C family)
VAPDSTIERHPAVELFGRWPASAPGFRDVRGDGAWFLVVSLRRRREASIYYRFVRTSPTRAVEADAAGQEIMSRVGLIDGPTQIHEVVAAWAGAPESIPTGRIVGTIFDALQGSPLPDILVSAGGRTAFTDGQGAFRLDDLPAGLHTLVALSPSGAYHPIQQGAIIAANSETPATLGLVPAEPITVTFQVTVPSDTPAGFPVRVAGNVLGLGNTFAELAGGTTGSVGRMPQMVMVDPTHYLAIVQLMGANALPIPPATALERRRGIPART